MKKLKQTNGDAQKKRSGREVRGVSSCGHAIFGRAMILQRLYMLQNRHGPKISYHRILAAHPILRAL